MFDKQIAAINIERVDVGFMGWYLRATPQIGMTGEFRCVAMDFDGTFVRIDEQRGEGLRTAFKRFDDEGVDRLGYIKIDGDLVWKNPLLPDDQIR